MSINVDRRVKDIHSYIENIKERGISSDYITVEHRNNNPKRDFLFVNKYQCKHIPCDVSKLYEMTDELASQVTEKLKKDHSADNILVVGFAETATAIGTLVAYNLSKRLSNSLKPRFKNVYLTHTTREFISLSKELITFEEEHSHATTQELLVDNDTDEFELFKKYKYILFVEDEISTGNTILNFIKAIEEKYGQEFRYGVASVCNWQSYENREKFNEHNVDTFYLIGGDLALNGKTKMKLRNGDVIDFEPKEENETINSVIDINIKNNSETFRQERLGVELNSDSEIIDYNTMNKIMESIENNSRYSIRVIGTEEFMAVPIEFAHKVSNMYNNQYSFMVHATTRSKIDVLRSEFDGTASGIKSRFDIVSPYDYNRNTYIYNLDEYTPYTIVMTDTCDDNSFAKFKDNITKALQGHTRHILFVRF